MQKGILTNPDSPFVGTEGGVETDLGSYGVRPAMWIVIQ